MQISYSADMKQANIAGGPGFAQGKEFNISYCEHEFIKDDIIHKMKRISNHLEKTQQFFCSRCCMVTELPA